MGPDRHRGELGEADFRGQVVARLLVLFKIRNVRSEAVDIYRLALLRVLDPINGGTFHLASGHIQVGKWSTPRHMQIVGIRAVIGQAHVFPIREKE